MSLPGEGKMTLTEYTAEVNRMAREDAAFANRGDRLFAAVHHDYPESMMEYYRNSGLTPFQAIYEIACNRE
jgi:hypothetical protein